MRASRYAGTVTAGTVLVVAVLTVAVMVVAWPVAAEGRKQLEACSRGNLQVCSGILARPRLAAGTRAAIEFYMEEIALQQTACAVGDGRACEKLERDYPDLPRR